MNGEQFFVDAILGQLTQKFESGEIKWRGTGGWSVTAWTWWSHGVDAVRFEGSGSTPVEAIMDLKEAK